MPAHPTPGTEIDGGREEVIALCRARPAGDDLLGDLADRLKHLVPFDASLFVATDPTTLLPAPPVLLTAVDEDCQRYWERELLVEDVLLYRDLARSPRPAGSLQGATNGHPSRSARHRELNARHGFQDELRVVFRIRSRCWGVASLWRLGNRPNFSAEEIRAVADIGPHVAGALRQGVLDRVDSQPPQPSRGPGLLMFDGAGDVSSMNEEAAGWLSELGGGTTGENGSELPTEVYSVISQAKAVASGRAAGPARTRVLSGTGRWVALHASCLRGGNGDSGQTAVVIEPAHASEIAPIIVQAYQLTEREQEVTRMIARGLNTDEIAEALFLSPHTVRGYVKSVFSKTGVGSRRELVAHLFAEHYYDELHR